MTKTKRGKIDHETLILQDLKEILKNIFDLKRFDKRTISRSDITYDSFITVDSLKPNLKGYKFFDFLFDKRVLIVEVKTPNQYFDIRVLAQIEDIQASYLGELGRKRKLKDEELDRIVIVTVVTSVSKKFIHRCRDKGVLIKRVKGKKGLYVLHRLIPVYIIVIDELKYDEVYVQLLKYIKDLERLISIIHRMKEGMRKEKFVRLAVSFVDYNPNILEGKGVKDMIPVFTDEKDRSEYIDSFLAGFGKDEVIKHFKPEEVLKNYKPEDRLEGLKPEEVLKNYKPEDRLEGLKPEEVLKNYKPEDRLEGLKPEEVLKNYKPEDRLKGLTSEDIKLLNKKDRDRLKKLLMKN